ncbi:MAG: DUF4258 domain-containing protein [Candidatus Riflebacteria bacterium]|nr:DUF4258 domain-containing protein [Candidatus Riflebacteria bacterium]
MRQKVRQGEYVMTLHADDEMNADECTIEDVESGIMSGSVVERQKDHRTGEWKYRIRGVTSEQKDLDVVVKLGVTGKVVIITVFVP